MNKIQSIDIHKQSMCFHQKNKQSEYVFSPKEQAMVKILVENRVNCNITHS